MISWMQKHRKYLVVTIWISTIAFIGAGFVGWGQYNYNKKAGAIATVGDVSITGKELQQSYNQLFNQYNQMLQGKFDQEQAKSFGLQKQAMAQLINQAYIQNLAKSYNLNVTDKEIFDNLKTQELFFKNGAFDKEVYATVLKQNRLTMTEYEADMRKNLLLQKTLKLFQPTVSELEKETFSAAFNIADKISYKVLTPDDITIDTSDDALQSYFAKNKSSYMTLPSYTIEYISQDEIATKRSDEEIKNYYNEHKHNFKNSEGKIMPLEKVTEDVINALNDKETSKAALKTYIQYKKGKLENPAVVNRTVDAANHAMSIDVFQDIEQLTDAKPYLKPRKVDGKYIIIKLISKNAPQQKSFEEAKAEVLVAYLQSQKKSKLQELAQNSIATFNGQESDFITRKDAALLSSLEADEANEFLNKLFEQQNRRGYVQLQSNKVVLFNILEQKLLSEDIDENIDLDKQILELKNRLLYSDLIKMLENRYQTEMLVKGI